MDPGVAKKTQDTLGKIIKKPPLTDKLLGKPPFRFLHDVMTSVVKTTGFMKGLYTESEMNSENVKEKEAKIAFLQKAIDMVVAVNGRGVVAKPAKIVAGHEPERTNEFLQALAAAISANADNDEYVKKVLSGGGGGGGGETKKEKGEKEEKKEKDKDRTRSASRRKDDGKSKKEDKEKSHDRDRDREKRHRDRDGEGHEEKEKEKHRDKRDKSRDREDRHKDRERRKKPTRTGSGGTTPAKQQQQQPPPSQPPSKKTASSKTGAGGGLSRQATLTASDRPAKEEGEEAVHNPPQRTPSKAKEVPKTSHPDTTARNASKGEKKSETDKSKTSSDAASPNKTIANQKGESSGSGKMTTKTSVTSAPSSTISNSRTQSGAAPKTKQPGAGVTKSPEKQKPGKGVVGKTTKSSEKPAGQSAASPSSKTSKTAEPGPSRAAGRPVHPTMSSPSFPTNPDKHDQRPRKHRDAPPRRHSPPVKQVLSPSLKLASKSPKDPKAPTGVKQENKSSANSPQSPLVSPTKQVSKASTNSSQSSGATSVKQAGKVYTNSSQNSSTSGVKQASKGPIASPQTSATSNAKQTGKVSTSSPQTLKNKRPEVQKTVASGQPKIKTLSSSAASDQKSSSQLPVSGTSTPGKPGTATVRTAENKGSTLAANSSKSDLDDVLLSENGAPVEKKEESANLAKDVGFREDVVPFVQSVSLKSGDDDHSSCLSGDNHQVSSSSSPSSCHSPSECSPKSPTSDSDKPESLSPGRRVYDPQTLTRAVDLPPKAKLEKNKPPAAVSKKPVVDGERRSDGNVGDREERGKVRVVAVDDDGGMGEQEKMASSVKVKASLSRYNLPAELSDFSRAVGNVGLQKEVEEKENESPEQNGEKESSQDAPSRLQRPTSAKGSRRRRQGREALDDDDEEFQQRDNREPAIGENDLPPQVTAARKMARPPSARPAPPRPKQDGVEAEPAMRLGTGAPTNVIVDDGKQSDDEDENFLVEESAPPPRVPEPVTTQADAEDDAEHGALVKKMLESKKEAEQQQQPTKKTEIERPALSDAQRRKQREMVSKEIERLQTSIQSLTRSANPLGKIMDYVQEDMDSMQKELERWRSENKEHALALRRERNVTDRAIEPLKAQLADLDRAITDQLDLIAASKSNIMRNDRRIEKMLQSIARS